ncbi:MAG: cytochrome B [Legionella sp.]|nr:MAG: cytochrome B [Legionella sp.]PJE00077.1 MAG: cytochrome B [Legionella sp.]
MSYKSIRIAAAAALLLAFFVVMLGAYTRLTDAGLGCPDWPGCYGNLVLPSEKMSLLQAQTNYPDIPIESTKAWTEMAHRYAAGTLGFLIIYISLMTLYRRKTNKQLPWHLPCALLGLLVFQAALGMWTVTLKLLPVVVMGHLLGGIVIVACLSRFNLQLNGCLGKDLPQWRPWMRLAVLIVFLQIALGGWVSSNYAGIACIGFPQCNGAWVPDLVLSKAFNVLSSIGLNYQGGLLDNDARVTIQWVHRLGALVTASYLLILAAALGFNRHIPRLLKYAAALLALLVVVQLSLGVLNVLYLLPLDVAVAHNGVAAMLLALVFGMLHFLRGVSSHAQ